MGDAENPASDARLCPLCNEPVDPESGACAITFGPGLFEYSLRFTLPIGSAIGADQWVHGECIAAMPVEGK